MQTTIITQAQFDTLWQNLLYRGGWSEWFVKAPTTGYVVGDGRKGVRLPMIYPTDPSTTFEINYYTLCNQLAIAYAHQGYMGIGFWVKNKVLYIDPIMCYRDQATAMEVAAYNCEQAIWDLDAEKEIPTVKY